LEPTDNDHWEMNAETGIARCTEKLASTELETCAACHSRRKVIAKNPMPGQPYLDSYLPALLQPGLYNADGQIDGAHSQINLCRAEERPAEYLITLQQPHCSIDLRPRLGRPGASSVRRDGVAG
jgi:hypothetical protein